MKFSFIKIFTILFLVFLFSGCENFLSGSKLVDQLDKEIEYANAQEIEIYIAPELNQGTTNPNGTSKKKIGYEFDVKFTEAANYQFYKWVAVNSDTGASYDDKVLFTDVSSLSTTVIIKAKLDNLWIKPVCIERTSATNKLPELKSEGVPRDSSIYITFSKKLSSDNDFSTIKILCNEKNVTEKFKTPYLVENTLVIPADSTNLIDVDGNSVEDVKVIIPDDLFIIENDMKVSLGEEITHSYKINKTTNNKAEIFFSVNSKLGSMTPENIQYYNIGESFNLSFEPAPDCTFTEWLICDSEGNEIDNTILSIENKSAARTSIKIKNSANGISITPLCYKTPKIQDYEPKYVNTGSDYDSNIIITFNKELKNESLVKENISIKDNQSKNDYSKYFNFSAYNQDGKSIIVLQPDYTIKELFTSSISFVDINIALSDSICDQDNRSISGTKEWYYRIKDEAENVKPELYEEIAIAKNKNALLNKNSEDFVIYNNFDDADFDVFKNHVSKSVWIKIPAKDNRSGIDKFVISEQLVYYISTHPGTSKKILNKLSDSISYKKEYSLSDVQTITDESTGNKFYIFEYIFKNPTDGVIRLNFDIYDKAQNILNYEKTVDLVVDRSIDLSHLRIYQFNNIQEYKDQEQKTFLLCFNLLYGTTFMIKDDVQLKKGISTEEPSQTGIQAFKIEFEKIEISTDGTNWESIDFTDGYTKAMTDGKMTYAPAVQFTKLIECKNDLYIKATIKDDADNYTEAIFTLQGTPEIIYGSTIDNIEIKPLNKTVQSFILDTKETPSFGYSVYYQKINNDGSESSLTPLLTTTTGPKYSATTTGKRYISKYLDTSTLSEGKYNLYVQSTAQLISNSTVITGNPWNLVKADYDFTVYNKTNNAYGTSTNLVVYPLHGSLSKPYAVYVGSNSSVIEDEFVPGADQFNVSFTSNGINSSSIKVKVTFQNFTKNPDLNYVIKYRKSSATDYFISDTEELDVDPGDYKVSVLVMNDDLCIKESPEKTLSANVDNIPPRVGIYNERSHFSDYYLTDELKDTDLKDTVKYWFSDSILSDTEIEKRTYRTAKIENKKIKIYLDFQNLDYLCIKLEDKNNNFSYQWIQFLPMYYKNVSAGVERQFQKESTGWTLSQTDDIFQVEYINNQAFTKVSISSGKYNIPKDETFVKIYPIKGGREIGRCDAWNTEFICPAYKENNWVCNQKGIINGRDAVYVAADHMSFTHTLYCSTNFYDDVDSWITKACEAETIYQSTEGATSYGYGIPLNEIPDDCWYTTVTHFADGTAKMSDVMKK